MQHLCGASILHPTVALGRFIHRLDCYLMLALALSYAALAACSPCPKPDAYGSDASTYVYLAQNLVDSGRYSEAWPDAAKFRAWRPPLYPIFIAAAYALGGTTQTVLIIQVAISIASGIVLYATSKLTFNSTPAAFLGTGAYYFLIPTAQLARVTMSETLFIFLFASSILTAMLYLKARHLIAGCLSAALAGLASLTRTIMLPFLLACLAMSVFAAGWRRVCRPDTHTARIPAKLVSIPVAVFLLVVAPVTARNYLVLDEFVFINSAGPMNLYLGTLSDIDWEREHKLVINPLRDRYGEVGSMRKLTQLALRNVLSNPAGYSLGRAVNIGKYLILHRSPIGVMVSLLVGLLAAVQVLTALRQRNRLARFLGLAFVVPIAATSVTFYKHRFVLACYPLYALSASAGLVTCVDLVRGCSWKTKPGRRDSLLVRIRAGVKRGAE